MKQIPTRVEKPWGHELWWARTERYVGKILHLKQGESLSLQYHNVKDETILLQSGRLLFETRAAGASGELQRLELAPGVVVHITPGTLHRQHAGIALLRKVGRCVAVVHLTVQEVQQFAVVMLQHIRSHGGARSGTQ